jgi:phosphoglycolate phosphatase-like HAD superfamily hydrolase
VVTGNTRPIALAKLDAFDLAEYLDLDVGGYGDDGRERSLLIRAALRRVQDRHGQVFAPDAVVVLGDTAHDIRGAHEVGARAVGVAKGPSSVAELTAFGADAVLADLASLEAVYAAVFGTSDLLQAGDGATASA